MKTIALPPILPGDLDLQEVNRQLCDRAARLDWQGVISAPQSALAVLLKGLDLSNDSEVLGFDEPSSGAISDPLMDHILAYFNSQPDPSPGSESTPNPPPVSPNPEVWIATPPNALTDDPSPDDATLSSNPLSDQIADNPNGQKELNDSKAIDQNQADGSPETSTQEILKKRTPAALRAELEAAIIKDLYGPAGGEDEEVEESRVTERYLVGVLAPQFRNQSGDGEPEQQDDIAIARISWALIRSPEHCSPTRRCSLQSVVMSKS